MYKYTYVPVSHGGVVICDVEFGMDRFIIVREKIQRLDLFVENGTLTCEVYDPKAPKVTTPTVPVKRGRGPNKAKVVDPPRSILSNDISEELDAITKAVMST